MLLWKDLTGRSVEAVQSDNGSSADHILLSIYLCRILLAPAARMKVAELYDRHMEGMVSADWGPYLGLEGCDSELPLTEVLARIQRHERELSFSLKGSADLSFAQVLQALDRRLGLNGSERKILAFSILLSRYPAANAVLEHLGLDHFQTVVAVLARSFNEAPGTIATALGPESVLRGVGLLEQNNLFGFSDLVQQVNAGEMLQRLLVNAHANLSDEQALFEHVCPRSPAAEFVLADFGGVKELQLIIDYLKEAMEAGERGRNLLLHGKPGTGKTQLARTIASHLGATLHQVPTHDDSDTPITGRTRLNAVNLAQKILADRRRGLLLFDEMEDAFREADKMAKGWFNQLLEQNLLPIIWISNRVDHLDPALLRRFDLIIEMNGTTQKSSQARIRAQLQELPVTGAWREAISQQSWMTPAVADSLRQMGKLLPQRQRLRNQQRLAALLQQRLRAMGESDSELSVELHRQDKLPEFRLEWLNTSPPLAQVERIARRSGSARLCLHGPPGAGKTAYASELAQRLNRPLHLHTGSSLLSMWVGEAEKNVARMFDKAEAEGAVLLLDEADTFLYSRSAARHSWEISLINEFMVRLERFKGIFLATTNRFDSFDKAVMRRFHLKVGFGCLDQQQVREMLGAHASNPEQVQHLRDSDLASLNHLTPGLFQVAVKQLELRGLQPKVNRLLEVLREEQRLQRGNAVESRPIGFIH